IFYEADDDYGISRIDLVAFINGRPVRRSIKNLKGGETSDKDGYTWNLAQESFEPGAEVQYYLEIKDNDNVFGPNTGQSET
ncbi:MAG: hypothetical protein GWM98_13575, partial [Nitrospinaceae bacterium]|nr:hypothetical protein [Nitrospinaceae bacterium]NIR55313.1 hypothetical protein [Nitrospinaceae bacterium]NIS85752.1 hypothetical protein [Nitrospinaceae bacterium]NIT82602.1 hypothetical protein [Nitrospinaceae bacterium]NIU44807.1 hypothetical protein [Nitrospinaceae bacterium]